MLSINNLNVLFILLTLQVSWVKINASRQVTLSCGSHEDSERGLPGYPGKRGPKGSKGVPGPKGKRGHKGVPGQCPDLCDAAVNRISLLEANLNALTECLHSCINGRCVNESNTYACSCYSGYTGANCSEKIIISDCNDVLRVGHTSSGVYNITVPGRTNPVQVYCDLNTDGGGWLVFQRRINGSVDFYRSWTEYQHGFGELNGEFWLGLDLLHAKAVSGSYQLRVDLEYWDGNTAYAVYRTFAVGNSQSNYRLSVSGYAGSAGDSLSYLNNQQFSTKDRDNDAWSGHCAQQRHGAWWYNSCHYSNLNGEYLRNGQINNRGVTWYNWKSNQYSMKRTEMKIKPN